MTDPNVVARFKLRSALLTAISSVIQSWSTEVPGLVLFPHDSEGDSVMDYANPMLDRTDELIDRLLRFKAQ